MPDETPRITDDERMSELLREGKLCGRCMNPVPCGCYSDEAHLGLPYPSDPAVVLEALREHCRPLHAEVARLRGVVADLETRIGRALSNYGHAGPQAPICHSLILHGGECNCWRSALAAGSGDGREAPAEGICGDEAPSLTGQTHDLHCELRDGHGGWHEATPLGSPFPTQWKRGTDRDPRSLHREG